jgi:hypothetical protein
MTTRNEIAVAAARARQFYPEWAAIGFGIPGVGEDGMPGRNEQRKPGTTRGSPRRSREGIAYKPPSGEIAISVRVGRMRPI